MFYLWCGTKSYMVDLTELDDFLKRFNGGYLFDVVLLLDSDCSCKEGSGG